MHINPKHPGPISPETTRPSQPADAPENAQARPVAPAPGALERSDKVEISDAGRALAARGDKADPAGLDPARAAHIRGRILNGAYDTLEVVDAVARRLLDLGDL
jgi:negative regulator of flagellin synthesis FlgM